MTSYHFSVEHDEAGLVVLRCLRCSQTLAVPIAESGLPEQAVLFCASHAHQREPVD